MKETGKKNKKILEGKRLKALRETLGYSQREMAQEFRVVHGTIGLWETGKRTIPGPVLFLMELYEQELGLLPPKPVIEEDMEKIQTRWLSRVIKGPEVGVKIAGQLALEGMKQAFSKAKGKKDIKDRAQEAIALQVVEALGKLKGLPMKLGQMISYMDFKHPKLGHSTYSKLQDTSPAMHPRVIAEILVGEFGQTPNQLFDEWTGKPFAAASIGQVHCAKLKSGEEVAVKIQYPGIEKTLAIDMAQVAVMDKLGSMVFKGQKPGLWVTELKERLMEECNYKKEASNQDKFYSLYKDHKKIVIPKVYHEFSTRHVLTSEFINGMSFKDFQEKATQSAKNKAGEIIWDFIFGSIFRFSLFSADPHPGNYLFLKDRVVFLDFGCLKTIKDEFLDEWRAYLRALIENKTKKANELVVKMGIASDPDKFNFEYHHNMMKKWYQPLIVNKPFQFTHDFVIQTWKKMAPQNPNKFVLNMPKDWIFLNHVHWGAYAVLAHLGATSNWSQQALSLIYAE